MGGFQADSWLQEAVHGVPGQRHSEDPALAGAPLHHRLAQGESAPVQINPGWPRQVPARGLK